MEDNIKRLENWVTFAEGAEILGISRQGFHQLINEQQVVSSSEFRILGKRPYYLISTNAIEQIKEARENASRILKEIKSFNNL